MDVTDRAAQLLCLLHEFGISFLDLRFEALNPLFKLVHPVLHQGPRGDHTGERTDQSDDCRYCLDVELGR